MFKVIRAISKPFLFLYVGKRGIKSNYGMLHTNRELYVVCSFNCYVENERLLNVTGSHIHCKSERPIISETVQGRDVVPADR